MPPESEKTGEHTSNAAGRMVEQVVGRCQLDAPNASHVRFCLRPVAAVLGVDNASRRRDVAAASAVPVTTTALASMAAEMGRRGFGKGIGGWDWPTRSLPLAGGPGVTKGGRGRTRAMSVPTQTRPKFGPRMSRVGRVGPNVLHRWGRHFGCVRTRCIVPLEMPLGNYME
jgi:hypothetical protein